MAWFGVVGSVALLTALGMPLLSTNENGPELVGIPLVVAAVCLVGFVVCGVAGLIAVVIA